MIGNYLLSLTPEQEDRVLTRPFGPWCGGTNLQIDGCLCIVTEGLATDWGVHPQELYTTRTGDKRSSVNRAPGFQYERLCERFGTKRINAAIRDRVLTNRLWRARSPAEAFALLP